MVEPLKEFERRYGVRGVRQIGSGRDGVVWYTDAGSVVKLHDDPSAYGRERDVYVMLRVLKVTSMLGHSIPHLIRHDDQLLTIEMDLVQPPFFLDFASAYAEFDVPDFPEDAWDTWHAEKLEQFGDDLPRAMALREALRELLGVVLLDLNPGNVKFE